MNNIWQQISSNYVRSFVFAGLMIFVLFGFGYAIGVLIHFSLFMVEIRYRSGEIPTYLTGSQFYLLCGGLGIAAGIVVVLRGWFGGEKIVLRASGARLLEKSECPELFNIVEEMRIASGLQFRPDICVINERAPNAFASGKSRMSASIAVTSGLLQQLNREELQGVVAHEMAHIVNRDVVFMTLFAGVLSFIMPGETLKPRPLLDDEPGFFDKILMPKRPQDFRAHPAIIMYMIISAIFGAIARMLYFAFSRRREFLADACAAQYTRNPGGLAAALTRISGSRQGVARASAATAPLYIVNPFYGTANDINSPGATHPPVELRIGILREMAGRHTLDAYQHEWRRTVGSQKILFTSNEIERWSTPVHADTGDRVFLDGSTEVPPEGVSGAAARDLGYKKSGYETIDCECGVRLRIPPDFNAYSFRCPHCKRLKTV